jgi:hypothetical protein
MRLHETYCADAASYNYFYLLRNRKRVILSILVDGTLYSSSFYQIGRANYLYTPHIKKIDVIQRELLVKMIISGLFI